MALKQPTEADLLAARTHKWTGVTTQDGDPTTAAWVAEMDFGTAPVIEERLIKAIRDGFMGYLPLWAGPESAQAFTRFAERRYGWVVEPEWVRPARTILTALHTTIAELTPPGSPVIVPTPSYMPFLTIPLGYDREVIEVPSLHDPNATTPEDAWSLNLEGIEAGLEAGAGLIVLSNPWNPTGRVLTVEEMRALHDLVDEYDALIFADEVWAPLVLGDPASFVSYSSLGPTYAAHTVTAHSASKGWNIAGLNAAQIVLPDEDLRNLWDKRAAAPTSGTCGLGVVGALAAYTEGDEWIAQVLSQVNTNLDQLEAAIAGTNVDYFRPEGTYLAWIGFDDYDLDRRPVEVLREDHGVSVNDGETLGAPYRNWIRVNAAAANEPWQKVVAAIGALARGEE